MIAVEHLEHRYGAERALVLDRYELAAGTHGLVLGHSGSGKTTLLHLLAGMLRPQQGTVTVAGENLAALSPRAVDHFRGAHIGFVPQKIHLLGSLTVLQNLLLAPAMAGKAQDAHRARSLLDTLGLSDKEKARPSQLSQGQAQRVAIARAVMNQPSVLLADEPTAALDDTNAEKVAALLREQAAACGATLLIATHDHRLKTLFENQITLGGAP